MSAVYIGEPGSGQRPPADRERLRSQILGIILIAALLLLLACTRYCLKLG